MKTRKMLFSVLLSACLPATAHVPPVMGWSSWNTYRVNISDSLIRKQAAAMKEKGLLDAGYCYVNIDDGFFGGRDADGHLLAHPDRFPDGLKPVVDYIHGLGFKAGIYSDAGSSTCGNYWDNDACGSGTGFYMHDQQDADFYFKENEFDFIKIDFCGGDSAQNKERLELDEKARYTAIRQAIDRTGKKDVRVNVCRWAFPGTWASGIATSWRIAGDIQPNWASVKRIIAKNRYLSAYAAGGAFNDMDMLEIGRGLSDAEERTHFGLWCMQSSPLLIGCDVTDMPEASLRLVTNQALIAINQDTLALQAYVAKADSGVFLYVKDIEERNGLRRAVAIYNSTDEDRTFAFDLEDIDLAGKTSVRDLFAQESLSDLTNGRMEVEVGRHDTKIYALTAEKRLERTAYEAETAWLERYQDIGINPRLGHALYVEAKGCSGGAKVAFLGNDEENWLEWRDVYSQAGGLYEMTVSYFTDEPRAVWCSVNGGAPSAAMLSGKSLDKMERKTLRIALKAGNNTIRLFNDNGWCADIDKMTLRRLNASEAAAQSRQPSED